MRGVKDVEWVGFGCRGEGPRRKEVSKMEPREPIKGGDGRWGSVRRVFRCTELDTPVGLACIQKGSESSGLEFRGP